MTPFSTAWYWKHTVSQCRGHKTVWCLLKQRSLIKKLRNLFQSLVFLPLDSAINVKLTIALLCPLTLQSPKYVQSGQYIFWFKELFCRMCLSKQSKVRQVISIQCPKHARWWIGSIVRVFQDFYSLLIWKQTFWSRGVCRILSCQE